MSKDYLERTILDIVEEVVGEHARHEHDDGESVESPSLVKLLRLAGLSDYDANFLVHELPKIPGMLKQEYLRGYL
jgi:hypothetical protein